MKHIQTFESFINEAKVNLNGIKKYLLLIWDATQPSPMSNLLLVFTSNKENDLDIPKGELADLIEDALNTKIDPDDFESEVISYDDFMDDYGSGSNPNKINLNKVHIETI